MVTLGVVSGCAELPGAGLGSRATPVSCCLLLPNPWDSLPCQEGSGYTCDTRVCPGLEEPWSGAPRGSGTASSQGLHVSSRIPLLAEAHRECCRARKDQENYPSLCHLPHGLHNFCLRGVSSPAVALLDPDGERNAKGWCFLQPSLSQWLPSALSTESPPYRAPGVCPA